MTQGEPILCTEIIPPDGTNLKIGMLLGSSNAQWRQDTQKRLEEEIKNATNKYVRLDLQRATKTFKHENRKSGIVSIVTVTVPTEKINEAEEGLIKVLQSGVASPVGRRMTYIPTRDRSHLSMARQNRALIRQFELRSDEVSVSTDMIKDLYAEVTTTVGKKMTVQQLICGLKNQEEKIIFTGAERLGKSKQTLLSFYKENEVQAREISYNIIATLQSLILANDYTLIMDDKKRAIRKTRERECSNARLP